MQYNQARYNQLKQKQVSQQPLTNAEYLELSQLSMLAAKQPQTATKSVSNQPKQVLFTDDNQAANTSLNAQQAKLKAHNETNSGLFSETEESNIFLPRKVVAKATGLDDELLRSAGRRGDIVQKGNQIEVKSLTEYVTTRLEKAWNDYRQYQQAKEALS